MCPYAYNIGTSYVVYTFSFKMIYFLHIHKTLYMFTNISYENSYITTIDMCLTEELASCYYVGITIYYSRFSLENIKHIILLNAFYCLVQYLNYTIYLDLSSKTFFVSHFLLYVVFSNNRRLHYFNPNTFYLNV